MPTSKKVYSILYSLLFLHEDLYLIQQLYKLRFIVGFQQQGGVLLFAQQKHHACFGYILIVRDDKFSHDAYI